MLSTELPIADTAKRMGRRPLDPEKSKDETKPTMVRLTKEVRARIEAAAGPNRMAVFIREAIETALVAHEKEATRKIKEPQP